MNSTAIRTVEQGTLADIAAKINAEHQQALAALNDGLRHAINAGQLLLEAKKLCAHGEWQPWLEQHFVGSARTARAYILVAQRWPQVEAKWQRVADLSFREALQLLAAPPRDEQSASGDFLESIPELSPDRQLAAIDPMNDSYLVEIFPSVKHQGYYYVAVSRGLNSCGTAYCEHDGRPVRYHQRLLAHALQYIHGVQPTYWLSEPAQGKEPWFVVEAEA